MFELFCNDMHKAYYDSPFARNQTSAASAEQQRPPRFAFSLPIHPIYRPPSRYPHHPLSNRHHSPSTPTSRTIPHILYIMQSPTFFIQLELAAFDPSLITLALNLSFPKPLHGTPRHLRIARQLRALNSHPPNAQPSP